MNKDLGVTRSSAGHSGGASPPSPAVSAVPAPAVNAELVAEGAANCLDPALFEPFIRKAADDFYERLLGSVQDYLIDNAGFNIGSRISAEESRTRAWSRRCIHSEAALADLVRKSSRLLEGLNARIDNAPKDAVPVFDGIAEFHAAICRARDVLAENGPLALTGEQDTASAMSAFGQDPKGLEAKPASAARSEAEGDAHPSPQTPPDQPTGA